jgi:prepilin-type N-terminal cleavage/methylation domain-containing protein
MTKSRKGFTLVELAVVIVIIGVLAAFGVPQFLKSVERSKAAEAFNYLSAMRSAQERFLAKNGVYFDGTIDATGKVISSLGDTAETLDINQTPPKYFTDGDATTVIKITGDSTTAKLPTWWCTLARLGTSSSYGAYTVTYDQLGFLPKGTAARVTGETVTNIPAEINPMGQ